MMVRHLIERAAEVPLGPALDRLVFASLGIFGVTVAKVPGDLDATAWGNARRYHPGWVYHGLLIGSAGAAALFLQRLLAGKLLPPELLTAMQVSHSVDGVVPGRPWRTTNYGLGLMIGQGEPPGEYVGRTGGDPGSTSAVYQLAAGTTQAHAQCTGAAFAPVDDPGMVETRALALAHCCFPMEVR